MYVSYYIAYLEVLKYYGEMSLLMNILGEATSLQERLKKYFLHPAIFNIPCRHKILHLSLILQTCNQKRMFLPMKERPYITFFIIISSGSVSASLRDARPA